jgi:hypothetical protein
MSNIARNLSAEPAFGQARIRRKSGLILAGTELLLAKSQKIGFWRASAGVSAAEFAIGQYCDADESNGDYPL